MTKIETYHIAKNVASRQKQARDYALRLKMGLSPLRAIQLSETTSGSYLAHFTSLMLFLILILFFIAPRPPAVQSRARVLRINPKP